MATPPIGPTSAIRASPTIWPSSAVTQRVSERLRRRSGVFVAGAHGFSQAIAAGGTAKAYEEGMTANCEPTTSGFYDFNHNPWVYYNDPTDEAECAADDVPSGTPQSGALDSDIMSGSLPTVGLLKPTLLDDTTDGTFATADSWLESWISLVQSGPDWKWASPSSSPSMRATKTAAERTCHFVLIAPA